MSDDAFLRSMATPLLDVRAWRGGVTHRRHSKVPPPRPTHPHLHYLTPTCTLKLIKTTSNPKLRNSKLSISPTYS